MEKETRVACAKYSSKFFQFACEMEGELDVA